MFFTPDYVVYQRLNLLEMEWDSIHLFTQLAALVCLRNIYRYIRVK